MLRLLRRFSRSKKGGLDTASLKKLNWAMQQQEPPVVRQAREQLMAEFSKKYGNRPELDTQLLMNEFQRRFDEMVDKNPVLKADLVRMGEELQKVPDAEDGMRASIDLVERLADPEEPSKKG